MEPYAPFDDSRKARFIALITNKDDELDKNFIISKYNENYDEFKHRVYEMFNCNSYLITIRILGNIV